jgi:hypothetical protein
VKAFKILGGVSCHFQNRKGKIDENHILAICMGLANRKIKKKPLHSHDWTASDFRKTYKLLPHIKPERGNAVGRRKRISINVHPVKKKSSVFLAIF